jgi:hypothetical protein
VDVHPSALFTDLLDQELRAFHATAAVSEHRSDPRSAPVTPPLIGLPQFHFQSTPYARLPRPEPKSLRTPLTLTAAQRDALAALNAMGAGLDNAMSSTEMRSAFRRLAHQCHPDRHPGSSAAEQASLSRRFATLTDHRRCLAPAFEGGSRTRP